MSKNITIIATTGTSLLTKDINRSFREGIFPADFTKCLKEDFDLGNNDTKEDDIINALNEDCETQLANYLYTMVLTGCEASAETNSINLLIADKAISEGKKLDILRHELKFILIHSNTLSGRACAIAISQFLQCDYTNSVVLKEITKLDASGDRDKFQAGIRELTDKIADTIREEQKSGNRVILNTTGGYKPEAAYATVCGLLNDAELYYTHEHMTEVVRMPPLPLGSRFENWYLYSTQIGFALEGSISKDYFEERLPADIRELMKWDDILNKANFTSMGEMLWKSYQNSMENHGFPRPKYLMVDMLGGDKFKPLKEKISKYIDKWNKNNFIWEGHLFPWAVDHKKTHCQNLLCLAEQLLSKMNILSPYEIYILIACIWLHDIGYCESSEYKGNGIWEDLTPDEVWKKHPLLTYQLLQRDYPNYGFAEFEGEAKTIATICKYHGKNESLEDNELKAQNKLILPDAPVVEIKPQLIAAILRLVDSCDMGIGRAGDKKFAETRRNVMPKEREFFKLEKISTFLEKTAVYLMKKSSFIDNTVKAETLKPMALCYTDVEMTEHLSEAVAPDDSIKMFRELKTKDQHRELITDLAKLQKHISELNRSMTISPDEYDKHLRINHAEIHPEKLDNDRWMINVLIQPHEDNEPAEVKQLLEKELKIDEDFNPVKLFFENRDISLRWDVKMDTHDKQV